MLLAFPFFLMPKAHHKKPIVHRHQDSFHVKKAKTKAPHAHVAGVHKPPKPKAKVPYNEASSSSVVQCVNAIHNHAAYSVRRMVESSGSNHLNLKSLTLAPHIENKKAVHAVTCEVLKNLSTIKEVIARTTEMNDVMEAIGSYNTYVLVYEVLMGQGLGRQRKGPAEKAVHAQKCTLKSTLDKMLQERNVSSFDKLIASSSSVPAHPRWARVNTIKLQVMKALDLFNHPPKHWPPHHQQPLEPSVDSLLNDLLRFPSRTDLHDHPLVLSGEIILQSKASCMPAHALAPQKGWHVVDCCAAPGNKTTHVSALLMGRGGGQVIAFDKDARRLKLLDENASKAGAGPIIKSRCEDFLSIDPLHPEFHHVKGIILDPSCSGSGTFVTRMDHLGEGGRKGMSEEKIEQLAMFQQEALLKTLSFPTVERICYSTCSVHERENERVVMNILPTATKLGFKLVDPFPFWARRGHDLFEGASMLIRTDPSQDETDGFFVAVFERKL